MLPSEQGIGEPISEGILAEWGGKSMGNKKGRAIAKPASPFEYVCFINSTYKQLCKKRMGLKITVRNKFLPLKREWKEHDTRILRFRDFVAKIIRT